MKVGIFETEHFEGSYPVIRLFDDGHNEITIFTNEETYRQFKYLFPGEPNKFNWEVKPTKRSKYFFIFDMYRAVKREKISILYLNTVSNNFIFYAFMVLLLGRVKVVLTIHNINTWFEYKRSFSFRRMVRYMGRRMLISLVKEFNVVALTMVTNLERRLSKSKKVYCIPGAVFEEDLVKQAQPDIAAQINVVVPGTVDGRRREYEQAFELLGLLEKRQMPVNMIFLGRFYGDYGLSVLEKCKQWIHGYAKLKFYEFEIVDQPEFDRVMNSATLVFIPSVLNTVIEDGVKEVYGSTISSGNLFDVIKHAKPFIVPEALQVDPFLERSCVRYKKVNHIADFIVSIRQDPGSYEKILQAAREASANYTIDKVRGRNPGLFNTDG